jgi:DNA-binding HxlR family transcriptional regulator
MRAQRRGPTPRRRLPALVYQSDPIRQSLNALGRKWTLLLLRDLAYLKIHRFGDFLRNNPGLSPRILSRRLREMQQEGLIDRKTKSRQIRYHLTPRGADAVLILLALLRYGLKHHVGPATPRSASSELSMAA